MVLLGLGLVVALGAVLVGVVVAARENTAESAGSAAPGAPVESTPPTTLPPSTTTTTALPPSRRAPGAVGVTTLTVVDPTRGTRARGGLGPVASRTLNVTVRYPVAGPTSSAEATDAPSQGTGALVVFAHGFDVSQATYSSLLHDLAAAGFVVAAPDFPLSTSDAPGAAVEGDEAEQARDISFVVDRLTDGTTSPSITAAIRPGPVGVVGHSDGAVTVLLAGYSPTYADPRIGAVISVSGAFDDYGGPWFSTRAPPLLALHGGLDELNPLSRDQELVANHPGPAALVVVGGASHLGAVTGAAEPAVARLMADDLAWRLSGATGGSAAVAADEAAPPLRLESAKGD